MGNRAVICTKKKDIGVYLHWNGGAESINTFLAYCELKGYRSPDGDDYGWARLCQVIGNFFGGSTSLGIDRYDVLDTDNGDNGTYIIEGWYVVEREFSYSTKTGIDSVEEMIDNLKTINNCQPEKEKVDDKTIEEFAQKRFDKMNQIKVKINA